MENKSLWTFFKNNHDAINELTENFTQYRNSLYQKVYQLKEVFPKEEYAPKAESQWIWNGVKERKGVMALVHDYSISGKRISVDTYIGLKCWEIKVFGRNK
ncbi:hypothetical protein [Rufibacter sp. XAAS-G3-1]|uniref:hypothetical protein n=1 Tax=Rufibacter sp. XAAS-G3-1 TaxID=2729134 RepID=UPI0015E7A2C2|nr:hypothetical protein [Rufibacter sp. XAAS-G3-1]